MVLSRPLHRLAVEQTPAVIIEVENPHQVRQYFIERTNKVAASATKKLVKAQARYKANYDKTVRPAQTLTVGEAMFVRRELREENSLLPSEKLRPKVDGTYEVFKVRLHTVKISRDGLLNTVSKDRVIRAT